MGRAGKGLPFLDGARKFLYSFPFGSPGPLPGWGAGGAMQASRTGALSEQAAGVGQGASRRQPGVTEGPGLQVQSPAAGRRRSRQGGSEGAPAMGSRHGEGREEP